LYVTEFKERPMTKHLRPASFLAIAGASFVLLALLVPSAQQDPKTAAPASAHASVPVPGAIDPQRVQDQDAMTWADYRPIPGVDWADPAIKPQRGFKLAVVGIDFPGQPFVITLPRGSDPFGNPQIDPIPRDEVPQFCADFWMKPSAVNFGRTINGYWMEQSRGRFGITDVAVFGPYRMPHPIWYYGLNEYGQNGETPDGSKPEGRMEPDCDALWAAAVGKDLRKDFDAVLRLYASYDETGVWQEFGEMKFASKDDIPPEWGNPNPANRASSRPATSSGRAGWPARNSGASPRCARARTRGRSPTSSATSPSACPTSTTIPTSSPTAGSPPAPGT